jgi:addiction module HigA family antidote
MALLAIHPGEHLQQELEALAMSAAAFARKIDVPANRITQIMKGERDITADTAIRLGHFFGTSAQFWMNLQTIYDLRLAQDRNGLAIKALPTLRQERKYA